MVLVLWVVLIASANSTDTLNTLLYGEEAISIAKDATLSGADLLSTGDIKIDKGVAVNGSLYAGGDIDIDKSVSVDGDVTAGGTVDLDKTATVSGITTESSLAIPTETIPVYDITPGALDVSVAKEDSDTLAAGAYNVVSVGEGATLIFRAHSKITSDFSVSWFNSVVPLW